MSKPSKKHNNELGIHDLSKRHPGITLGISACYSEAASVCLDRHHESPIDFTVKKDKELQATAAWLPPDERTKKSWANTIDTTETGAYCIALAAIEVTEGLVAVARAETHTGADYYLAPKGDSLEDLESTFRLEVSGVDEGGDSIIRTRLKKKLIQAAEGQSSLPAIAAVVGFKACQIMVANVD